MPPATSTDDGESDWWDVDEDPDAHDDLGYELVELDLIYTDASGREQVLVMPNDEDMLRDDAYLVAGEDDLYDLELMV
jgi:hypothetical protein